MVASVLVVDDDPEIISMLSFLLEREGFQVESFDDGHQAREYIDMTDSPVNLAILDVSLPFIDGYHLLKEIRAKPTWKGVPVIMLTGLGADKDVVHAFDTGASDFVHKPFQPAELMARVRRLIVK